MSRITAQERAVIEALLALASQAWNLADNSEEHRKYHVVWREDFDALSRALDVLEELPDDQPGYVMAEAAKARWALRALLEEAPVAEDKATPGPWYVRKRERDGELLDCFVSAPDCNGFAYDAEILGDDEYRDNVERKLADCELIVAAVNKARGHGHG